MVDRKIYCVDDHPTVIKDIRELILGAVVLTAGSVGEAKRQIPDQVVASGANLAIIDGQLPDGSGADVVKLMTKAGLHLPVIAYSALSRNNINFGDIYVDKGASPQLLIDAVDQILPLK